jgi:hypothetical protein
LWIFFEDLENPHKVLRLPVANAPRLLRFIHSVVEVYDYAKPQVKDKIIRVIFTELIIGENTLNFQCTTGFKPLSTRFIPNCDPTGSRTPLPSLRRMCPNR